MRLNRAVAVLLLAGGLTMIGSPAHAQTTIVVPLPDVSTPGHAKGTVEGLGETPFVLVDLGHHGSWPGPHAVVPVVAGVAEYDLETWGFDSPIPSQPEIVIGAVPCAGPSIGTCSGEPVLSPAFEPTDVAPQVTWPTDPTIGPGQTVSIEVSDPQGGGELRAQWDPAAGDGTEKVLTGRNGTFAIDLTDGEGEIRLRRCLPGSPYECHTFDPAVSHPLVVRRKLTTVVTAAAGDGAVTVAHPTLTATVDTNSVGSPDLDLVVLNEQGQPVAVPQPDVDPTTDADGVFTFRLDAVDLPTDAYYTLSGTVTIDDPDFGVLTGPLRDFLGESVGFYVDTVGPTNDGLTVSRTEIHPRAIDALRAYRTVAISITDSEQLDYHDLLEIRNGSGTTVRHLEPSYESAWLGTATWDGRDDAGALVPGGTYRVVPVDENGNPSATTRTVTVAHTAGTLRTYRRTLSAAATTIDKAVGRCSTLRRPALRGWSGSLGYYSNSRCRGSDEASTVSTLNALRLPVAALRYADARVDTYGGAARRMPRSRGLIRLWVGDRWSAFSVMSRTLGAHTGPRGSGTAVDRDRWVVWNVATALGNRYDVKSFTVTVRYYSWT